MRVRLPSAADLKMPRLTFRPPSRWAAVSLLAPVFLLACPIAYSAVATARLQDRIPSVEVELPRFGGSSVALPSLVFASVELPPRQTELPPAAPAEPPVMASLAAPRVADSRLEACMALTMLHEAAAGNRDGLRAVAHVILNRTRHPCFPQDPCEVVLQPYQFTSVHFQPGLHKAVLGASSGSETGYAKAGPVTGRALAIAREEAAKALVGDSKDPTAGSIYFVAQGFDWRSLPHLRGAEKVGNIGGNVFFKAGRDAACQRTIAGL